MALNQKEQAVIDLVINGQAAQSSLRELTGAYNAMYASVSRLREADNPQYYAEQVRQLALVRQARDAERQSILSAGEAQKTFFSDFKKGFREIEEMAEHVTIGTLIYKGISWGLDGIRDLFNGIKDAYAEAVKTQTQLEQVVKSTGGVAGESVKKLDEYQQKLMDQTGIDDDVIAKGEEMLLTFTNIRGRIYEQALPAIVDMTAALNHGNVSMETIQQTSIQVGKALNDPINGMTALRKVGVTLDEQQRQQIKTFQDNNNIMGAQEIILKELQKEFGGTAKAIADTDIGAAQKFETRIGNIKENLGKLLVTGKSLVADFLNPFVGWIEKITSSQLSETLEKERVDMNKLVFEITDSNTANEDRAKLIDKLKNLYPDYLGYLDREKSTNKQIAEAGERMNEMYINRIVLAQKDEDIEKQNQKTAELKIKILSAEDEMRTRLAKLKDQHPDFKEFDMAATTADKLAAVLDHIRRTQDKGLSGGGVFDPTFAPGRLLNEYGHMVNELNTMEKGANLMIEKRNALMKELNINPDFTGKKDGPDVPVVAPTSGPSAAEQAAAQKKLEQFKKSLEDTRAAADQLAEAARKGTLDDLDAQIKVIQDKYQKVINEIQKLMKDPHATAAIRKELSGRLNTLSGDEKLDEANTTAAFKKAQEEKAQKEKDEQLKAVSGQVNNVYDTAKSNLDSLENKDLSGVDESNPRVAEQMRLNIQDQYAKKRYELEKANLEDLKELQQAYGKDTSAIDRKIADATIKENQRAAKKKEEDDQKYLAAKKQINNMEMTNIQEGADLLASVLDKKSGLYKAALVVDKAIAVARVIINTNEAIAAFTAANAGIPLVGEALIAEFTIQSRINEGIQIASIIAATAQGLTGAKAAKGGVFQGSSHDQGGLDVFDRQTGRHVVNVEGGEPFLVLSKETQRNNGKLINELLYNSMYRNGASVDVGNVNRGIQIARHGGVFSNQNVTPAPAFAPGNNTSTGGQSTDMSETNRLLAGLHDKFDSWAQKPWAFPMREFYRADQKNKQIQQNGNGKS